MSKSERELAGSVVLAGFEPLTADILARLLSLRGLATCVAPIQDGGPSASTIVVQVDPGHLQRLHAITSVWPGVPIVIVANTVSGAMRQGARRAGAAALVPRSAGLRGLLDALSTVLEGGRLDLDEHAPTDDALVGLTERETLVLRLVADGSSNTDIGMTLGISPHTARTHVQNVMAKLGVRNRLAAAAVARDAGLTGRPAP